MLWIGCNRNSSDNGLTVDMSKAKVLDTNAPPVNLPAEIARAKTENKLLLLEFGSSDSCPPCVLFEEKVFSMPEFQAYDKSNLDFIRIDLPENHTLRPDTLATNIFLAKQFDVAPIPVFIALDKNGKEFWRQEGLTLKQFNPTNFIALIESVKAKEK